MNGKRAMNPFSPFYPPRLQHVVNHAERCAELVKRRCASSNDENASAWLLVECFVRHIVHDWTFEVFREDAAAATMSAYLDSLHDGLAMHFGAASATCCAPDLCETAVPLSTETAPMPTRCPGRRFTRRRSTSIRRN